MGGVLYTQIDFMTGLLARYCSSSHLPMTMRMIFAIQVLTVFLERTIIFTRVCSTS